MRPAADVAALAEPYRPGMDTLVQLSSVTKQYDDDGAPALAGVSMEVSSGESLAVMGPSGSGKSTLLNLVAGLDRPTAGTITVGGERVDALSETGLARFRRRQIGMIFQFFNLLDDMTVLDNVLLPAQLAGMPTAQARARADELLTALRIGSHRNAYPARLSGGERQRVAIARALVNSPELLLADEPTGNVDPGLARRLLRLFVELHRLGTAVVIATHDLQLMDQFGFARRLVVGDGRIAIFDGVSA
jgi:putative ABC transport system ATP-binding protein